MDLYQDCSYDAPGVETGLARGGGGGGGGGGVSSQLRNIGTKKENQECSYGAPGVKTGLAPGVTISKNSNKDGKLQNSSFLKLEGAEV